MSRIYFHSQHGDSEVSGAERAYMGNWCGDLFVQSLGLTHDHDSAHCRSPLRLILKPQHYSASLRYEGRQFVEMLSTALRVGYDSDILIVDGKPINTFATSLNSAYVCGSDVIKLMARLHGQCELHTYVEGPNREWLASLIERGCKTNILRGDMGWEETASLLRAQDDCPVVTSYSVCESFPNPHIAKWKPKVEIDEDTGEECKDFDAWYDLESAEQWRLALEGLRVERNGLELDPDTWQTFYFADGINGFQLRTIADGLNERLKALSA